MAKRLDQILVVDLEATCWPGDPPVGQESDIIEIGLCTLGVADVPGQFHADRRHESLSLWLVWRPGKRVHMQQHDGEPVPGG